jgi:flagellar motor switch protein FliM
MSLTDPTAFYALAIPPFDELGALEINPAIAFTMIDRMLGGAGQPLTLTRALSDIEQNVIDSVVKLLLGVSNSWRPLSTWLRHPRPGNAAQMLQVMTNEIVIGIIFEVRIGATGGGCLHP